MRILEHAIIACAITIGMLVGAPMARAEEEGNPWGGGASGLKVEHFAWAYAGYMYLDGPKLEATCYLGRPGAGLADEEGNVWFGAGGNAMAGIGGRCVNKETGIVTRHFGDDYWYSPFDVDEGPGSAMFNMVASTGLGQPMESQFIWGSPLQGGDKGFILFSTGFVVRKVYMNPEKDNRWWFKTIIGGGKQSLPKKKGSTIAAREMKDAIKMVQAMPDGRIIIFAVGGFYEYREEEKDGKLEMNLVCLLGYDDYKDQGHLPDKGGKKDVPTLGVMGGDGTFYLGTYFRSGYSGRTPCIWRVVPGGELEAYAWSVNNAHLDGPAMFSGGMCGHHIWMRMHNYNFVAPSDLLIMGHDEFRLRRIRNGRVSTVCPDGAWHELKKMIRDYRLFHTYAPGPGGTATVSSKVRKGQSSALTYIVSGINYKKETVGEQITAPRAVWPREEGFKTLRELGDEKDAARKAEKAAKKAAEKGDK